MPTQIEDLKDTIRRAEEHLGKDAPILHLLRAQLQGLLRQERQRQQPLLNPAVSPAPTARPPG